MKESDTDILVIAISVMSTLQAIGLQQLWIVFDQGRNTRWIPEHGLYRLRKAGELHDVMPSLVAVWSHPSVVKELNLHGRPGNVC